MPRKQKSTTLYPHPFSKAYWRDAAAEVKDTKMLVFAALMIAIRVAMKLLAIPLAPGLKINTAFIANALGAMVYGPVMAAICACVSDVLGFLIVQDGGIYFPPFVLTEIAGSVIFALFLYRAKVTPLRVMLSRFCICFFVNVLLQTPLMIWYYTLFMDGKAYLLTIPGILKNLFMFPIESVVLTLFLSVMLPITNRLKLTYTEKASLKFNNKQIALLLALVLVGTGCVGGYLTYYYKTTSLSAKYTDEERPEKNQSMLPYLRANSDTFDDVDVITIIDSAKKEFLGKEITYTVSVYAPNEGLTEGDINDLWAKSKSKAAKDKRMTKLATAVIVVNERDGSVVSFTMQEV